MKTTARSIAQITKYRTPSVWNPLAAVRHKKENWSYFPEPSMVFIKEETGEEKDRQMFSLLFQLLNYDFSSKNQYFLRLEMQPLLQELKILMAHGTKEESIILEKIDRLLTEVLHLREVHEKSEYWLGSVETMKQQVNILMEHFLERQMHVSAPMQVIQNTQKQIKNWDIHSAEQIGIRNSQQIRTYENLLNRPFKVTGQVLTAERWKNDMRSLQTIYEGMSKEEQTSFLSEISMTETELLSTKNMTQEQWETFLTASLPLISAYADKREEKKQEQQVLEKKEILQVVSAFTETQWQSLKHILLQDRHMEEENFKQILSQNRHIDIQKLHHFFDEKTLENTTSFESWMQEKQAFIAYVQKNQFTSLLKNLVDTVGNGEHSVLLTEKKTGTDVHRTIFTENSVEKISDWVTQLTLNRRQAVQTPSEMTEQSYAIPQLDSVQVKEGAEQAGFAEEKRPANNAVHQRSNEISAEQIIQNRNILEKYLNSQERQQKYVLSKTYWEKDVQLLFHIYHSMKAEEKASFLRELSVTESELLSLQTTAKEQWEIFLEKSLPLISSYIQKQEQEKERGESKISKELLYEMETFVETQFRKMFFTSSQNRYIDFWNQHTFLQEDAKKFESVFRNRKWKNISVDRHGQKLKNLRLKPIGLSVEKRNILESSQISNFGRTIDTLTEGHWKRDLRHFVNIYRSMETEEQSRFLEEISMTETELLSVQSMTKEQWDAFLTDTKPLITSFVKKQEEAQKTLQITEFLRHAANLTEIQWQEVKDVFMENHEKTYINPILEMMEQQKPNLEEPLFSAEKRGVINYLTEHTEGTLEVIQLLQNRAGLKEIMENWVVLPSKERIAKVSEIASKPATIFADGQLESTVKSLTEWLTYLTESQWQEVKEVFVENSEKTYINPILEMMERQTPNLEEPLFSAEKRGVINYLAEHREGTLEVIQLLQNRDRLKETMENWVILPSKERLEKVLETAVESEMIVTDEQLESTAESLTEWLAFLTENQWQEVKSVLENHQNAEYITPLMEIVASQKAFEMEPQFSAEKRGAMQYIAQNKQAGASLIKVLMKQKHIEENLSEWVDLTLWKEAKEQHLEKSAESKNKALLPEEITQNTTTALTKFLSVMTESQWKEMHEMAVKNQQFQHLQPMLTLSQNQEDYVSFETEKKVWIDHITGNRSVALELLKLIEGNKQTKFIFRSLQQKMDRETQSGYEKPSLTQLSVFNINEQGRTDKKIVVQRMTNWLHSVENNRTFLPVRKADYFDNVQKNLFHNHFTHADTSMKNTNHFSGVLYQEVSENTLLQPDSYDTAQMVMVKKSQGNAMVQTPPKIPEVVMEAKKAMQTEVHDIITRKRSQEPEQSDNKTVLELMRRLDVQQKELEKIRSTQKQILNITDISVVTEKIMNHMQSQLRLEKMRRGL